MKSRVPYRPNRQTMQKYAAITAEAMRREFKAQGITLERCQQDIKDQQDEQLLDDTLRAQYREHHTKFLVGQYQRYQRYRQLLGAMLAIHRDDPVMKNLLSEFRPTRNSRRATQELPPTTPAVQPPAPAPTPTAEQRDARPTAMA